MNEACVPDHLDADRTGSLGAGVTRAATRLLRHTIASSCTGDVEGGYGRQNGTGIRSERRQNRPLSSVAKKSRKPSGSGPAFISTIWS